MDGASAFLGKHLLAGLTYVDAAGDVVRRIEAHGPVLTIEGAWPSSAGS